MNKSRLYQLFEDIKAGKVSFGDAEQELINFSFEKLDQAHVDHSREARTGFAEVIYGEFKTAGQIADILEKILQKNGRALATRVAAEKFNSIRKMQTFESQARVSYNELAKTLTLEKANKAPGLKGSIAIVCAGTADLPVLEEARVTAEFFGARVFCCNDVGVAGLHRLLDYRPKFEEATVCIVIAGMEGALPSVVAGMISTPVIAVPTSIGYGANLQGVSALLAMLNSCAASVSVVNIDNGFGAAQMACSILKKL